MGLYEGRGQLGKLIKDLQNRWHETRMNWDDEQARRFEERFIEPLEQDLRIALSAMDEMGAILGQIRNECQ
jgi:hypothetical protein